jgi:transcriptional regulator GlxA family with amidase domain
VLVDVIVFDGFDEMDALGPLEVFHSAEMFGADVRAQLVTRTSQPEVRAAFGLRVVPDAVYEPGAADVVLVPGGGWNTHADPGAWGEYRRGDWLPLLAAAADTAQIVAGVCTGTMLLAHAGVVGTRPAATHRVAWDDLAATGAQLVKDRVVDDGNLVTSGAVTCGLDLAMWIVEREFSVEIAEKIALRMEHAPARPVISAK